ncbi:MAG: RsmB/NOP family class I SAM-dependent RNA methyltransferase [Anderseniella sp.]|jgi:16S rRNA (cytosine967-C5)-methyltransferase|nr:RsmB/NOP family class I SAM-dependent RNA methyltransferase [Anderseniella sp.]
MHLAGRLAAAIEVLDEMATRHRPASLALADWGRAHRFAGSGDRAAIGNIVYDVMRKRALLAWRMGAETPRALVIAWAVDEYGASADEIAAMCAHQHGPGALTGDELKSLEQTPQEMPAHIAANVPEWLWPSFVEAFASKALEQAMALAERAPVDLRANTLKATREKLLAQLAKFGAAEGPLTPDCIRIEVPDGLKRTPNLEAEPAFQRGLFEIQDAASQAAALLVDAQPGMQVADICAGGGGKTLALAAHMHNKGQLYAWDADRNRLKPIIARINRAGVRNVQVIPADEPDKLEALAGRFDRVLVDAPCSGSGSWRRKPDARWRFTPESLANRQDDQRAVLDRAAGLVKPGGRVVYVTCSVLPQENTGQIEAFLARHPQFRVVPFAEVWRAASVSEPPVSADGRNDTLLLTPATHGSDGFFAAVLEKAA